MTESTVSSVSPEPPEDTTTFLAQWVGRDDLLNDCVLQYIPIASPGTRGVATRVFTDDIADEGDPEWLVIAHIWADSEKTQDEQRESIQAITLTSEAIIALRDYLNARFPPAPDSAMSREDELRTMPYADYLKTPEWRARRRRMLRAAGNTCQLCNAGGELHVHHRTYERRGNEWNKDLIVLCQACHQKFHDR